MKHQHALLALTRERMMLRSELGRTMKELEAMNSWHTQAQYETGEARADAEKILQGLANRRDMIVSTDKELTDSMNALAFKTIEQTKLEAEIATLRTLADNIVKMSIPASDSGCTVALPAGFINQLHDLVVNIDEIERGISDGR